MAISEKHINPCQGLEESLLLEKGWCKAINLTQFPGGFWIPGRFVLGAMAFQQHFQAQKDDSILVTVPKSGSTWLKALAFAIVNRTRHDVHNHHPLYTTNPHDLVPFLEMNVYSTGQIPDLTDLPSQRLFATHLPYQLLPKSILAESGCKIVYLCRNPKDTFISMWKFLNSIQGERPPIPVEEALESFCKGISPFGPFWEHVLRYWKASEETPERVLFMKYEDLKEEPGFQLKRLAEFLGYPFSPDEEREGAVEEILKLCSFETLSSLDVNKNGKTKEGEPTKVFFRRGIVGDWVNHLSDVMKEKLDHVIQEKLQGSGLNFKD